MLHFRGSDWMRICHVTPHLPPDQAANALLPLHLARWSVEAGDEAVFLSHRPRAVGANALPGPVTWIPSHRQHGRLMRMSRLATLATAIRIVHRSRPVLVSADLVHVHSNGLLTEVVALVAERLRKPVVLTLYGTEIWHYRPRRVPPDLFTRAYRRAAWVTFYSHGLMSRAEELGLARRESNVIYPPVVDAFRWAEAEQQAEARASLGLRNRHVVLNVKRLHPLAGQRVLIQAMNEVIRTHPDSRLIICGTGPLLADLQAAAREAGVQGHVVFAGLVPNTTVARYCQAADVFVLPSVLEACPTVALEALACGTPVITSDSPGGRELNDLFGPDAALVPRDDAMALAHAIVERLDQKRRARTATRETIERELRPPAVFQRFRDVYRWALEREPPA
jgi:glycosyltransferase involved in cell wall biosynthesis